MKKLLLIIFSVFLAASFGYSQIHIIDDFENDLGHFKNTHPRYSGSSIGFNYHSLGVDSSTSFRGEASMHFVLTDDPASTAAWVMRFISGTAAALSQNDTLGSVGYIGYALKAIGGRDSVYCSIAVDAPATAELGTKREIIRDGNWYLYQWNLADTSEWTAWLTASANGIIEDPVSVDALTLFAPDATPDIEIWIDYLVWNPGGEVPVELVSFASTVDGNNIELRWVTGTETNNAGFEIQRKAEGGSFEKIGFVEGRGTTTEMNIYTFNDQVDRAGKYSYRLKQIDYDGTYEFSKIIEVEVIAIPGKYALAQNYPNPFNPATMISYFLPEAGKVTLTVFNMLGEKVADLVNELQESGSYKVNFDASNLSSGTYIYTLNVNGKVFSKKMQLIK
jgi:hypothetical protein